MREHVYQKMWFKNFILILIPTLISVIGVVISNISNQTFKLFLIISTIILLIILISFMIYSSNFEESIYQELQQMKDKNIYLTSILAHMENDYKTAIFEISSFSDLTEKWAGTINSFAHNIIKNGAISDKAWNKVKIIDTICMYTKNIIQQYCNNFNKSNISVAYISYTKDDNNEEWIHMSSHSDSIMLRPNACKCKVRLSECTYHYADLIRTQLSDLEIAMDNNEILRIFKKVSTTSDLSKYTQYIAIPLYCKSGNLLGIFQIVTKYNYIIETDKQKMIQFITNMIIPFANLIVLTDKIYKGLYINPQEINEEVD